jgi:SAM-dependent MidA family methyltransferase
VLLNVARARFPRATEGEYISEINLAAEALLRTLGALLERGLIMFVDYGFPAGEYYHPQRDRGTLMCHYRQRTHDDPFFLPGLQDITAHVDFSAIAHAGVEAGLTLAGYTAQAGLLMNCGILDLLGTLSPEDATVFLPQANAVQKLLSPAEMGELFKAIALTKDFDEPLVGFAHGDRRYSL